MTLTAQDVAQHIAAGDYDGNLVPILEALQARLTSGEAATRWVIKWGDVEIDEDDLTLEEAFKIEKIVGCTWHQIEPLQSAAHCRAILLVALASRTDATPEVAEERLKGVTVSELMEAIRRREVNPAPFDSAT